MRSFLPHYQLVAPPDLGAALALLAEGDWRPFAGGTDLMVLAEAGKLPARRFCSLWGLAALRGFAETPHQLSLGALTTYSEIQRSDLLQRELPLLCAAAAETGGLAIQNRGTLGGNLANASPAADSSPALLAYDAELELISARGTRRVPYAAFHRGYRATDLAPDELIARVHLPRRSASGWRATYRKVGTRKAQAISKLCFAAALRIEDGRVDEVRIALGSVAPVPLRCFATEALLRGEHLSAELIDAAAAQLDREIAPIDDFRSTARYRRRVAANLLRDFLAASAAPRS